MMTKSWQYVAGCSPFKTTRNIGTYCLSSSLKSSRLLFFFSFSLLFLADWKKKKKEKSNTAKDRDFVFVSVFKPKAILTCRLSTCKNWGGVSRGRMLLDWDSKRDLGLYSLPRFSSVAASSGGEDQQQHFNAQANQNGDMKTSGYGWKMDRWNVCCPASKWMYSGLVSDVGVIEWK